MAAAVVGAIDKQPTNAYVAHLGEGDFLWAIDKGAGRQQTAFGHRLHKAAQPVDLDQALWRPLGKRMRLRNNQGGEPKCASASLLHLSALLSA